ncbi:MAG: hypothetical protein IT379_14830 [Deltaproteobacteria bacterium]|nr:hypothetical protein [Deltaproteobacteria bacterium]
MTRPLHLTMTFALSVAASLAAIAACAGTAERSDAIDASVDMAPDQETDAAGDGSLDDAGPSRHWPDRVDPAARDPRTTEVREAAANDDGDPATLAPRCERPELDPLLEVVGPTTFWRGPFPPGLRRPLRAIVPEVATGAADIVVIVAASDALPSGETGDRAEWSVLHIDANLELTEPIVFERRLTAFHGGGGARTRDGAVLVAARRGQRRESAGTTARVALVRDGEILDGPEMHAAAPAVGIADSVPVIVGDEELLVSSAPEGILASRIGEPGRLVAPAQGTIVSPARVLALDATRFVVAWNEQRDEEDVHTRIAVVQLDGATVIRTVFEPVEDLADPVALATIGGEVWIARLERRVDSLDSTVLRVAHLDTDLARIDPDRWLGGWGGFAPANLALVELDRRPWLVWVSADVRYGPMFVVHGSPLPLEACGRDVGAAAFELPRSWRGELDLAAAAGGDTIWVSIAVGAPTDEAVVYRFVPR